ncbi:hypothetical protein SAMN05216587_101676 [Selenomonas ruminantium]|uniref:Uncharacterized protein n=1 Tax=Selenomonas ruminantium TaxID=971 RepID=A0A1I0VJ16_SELRU|nr:hypothetical protein SAMN05216587_101676 [Selenomonas ruminantium]
MDASFTDIFGMLVGLLTIPVIAKIFPTFYLYLLFYWATLFLGFFVRDFRILYFYSSWPCLLTIYLAYQFYTTDKSYSWEAGRQLSKKEIIAINYNLWRDEMSLYIERFSKW